MSSSERGGLEEEEVPPAVSCALCRRPSCPGCERQSTAEPSAGQLPWETGTEGWSRRLWRTALCGSTQPALMFGGLTDGPLRPAVSFAFLAELMAIGSLGAVAAVFGWALAPEAFVPLLSSPRSLAVAAASVLLLSSLMVGLHAIWGLCIELGAGGTGSAPRYRHGMRFGLYACGWDLVTSPAGVLQGLAARGLLRAWAPIAAAVRVPRTALQAYVQVCRKLDLRAQRRGMQLSVVVLGTVVVLTASGLLAAAVGLAGWAGYWSL